MKVLASILGVLLILPGLCCVGFGLLFASSDGGRQFGIIELLVGIAFTALALALFGYAGKRR